MAKKRITFAMIEAGGGHKMPALAVYESLAALFPGKYDMQVLDFMKDLGCTDLDTVHKKAWKYLLSHPNLTKGFQTFDFITGPVNIQIYKLYLEPFYKYVLRYLKEEKPDLIFSTHYFNTMAVSYVRKNYSLNPLLINFLSEIFDFDSYWYLKHVDHYIVTSERAQQKLLKRRFPKGKLQVFPYPVRDSFFDFASTREEIQESLGIDGSKRTLLITLGSEGIGSIARMVGALIENELPLNVLVVTGKNSRLKRQLEEDFGSGTPQTRLIPLGFVERMNELIYVSDFCFIKPGPATTWEVLSLRRPILFYASAQLSENPNIRYAVRNKVGYYVGLGSKRFVRLVRLCMEDSTQAEIQASYSRLRLQNGAGAIARFVDRVLGER